MQNLRTYIREYLYQAITQPDVAPTRSVARISWGIIAKASVLFFLFFGAMALVQFATPDMPDNDGFYHIRLAQLMRTEGLKVNFPWLPLSVLNSREFSDHHFLFHVALIPFTFGDLRLGAKWAAVTFAALAFLSVWSLLHAQRVRFASLWALGLLAVSEAFLYRMSITRAQSLSLAFLALGLHFLFHRRYRWLIPLAFLYVWFYNAFPLLFFLAAIYALVVLLLERRLEWKPVAYVGLGFGLGLLINPYFPDNLIFFIRHVTPKLSETTSISVGSEWYPYDTSQLLENSPLALIVFLAGVFALGLQRQRMDIPTAVSFLATVMFGVMLFQSRRFIEYFPAFALIFAALAWAPLLSPLGGERQFQLSRLPALRLPIQKIDLGAYLPWLAPAILGLFVLAGAWKSLRDAQVSIRTSKPYTLYAGASRWLRENTPPGERVFQTDWDDFPRLFFYNTHNTYLIGLDPTYMQLYDPDLYELWVDITRGNVEKPSDHIYPRFGSRYVISDLKHSRFLRQAEQDPGLKEVFRDQDAVVYQVLEAP